MANEAPKTYIGRGRMWRVSRDADRDQENLEAIRDSDIGMELGEDGAGMSGVEYDLLDWEPEA